MGGADQVAFVANSEVWIVNMDGSELTQLTTDGQPKTDLQWVPGTRTLVYQRTNVNSVDADTKQFDTIMSFPFAKFLEVFRISPDGKQVALSLNREMYIVPFDLAQLKAARGRDALIAMKGCPSLPPVIPWLLPTPAISVGVWMEKLPPGWPRAATGPMLSAWSISAPAKKPVSNCSMFSPTHALPLKAPTRSPISTGMATNFSS